MEWVDGCRNEAKARIARAMPAKWVLALTSRGQREEICPFLRSSKKVFGNGTPLFPPVGRRRKSRGRLRTLVLRRSALAFADNSTGEFLFPENAACIRVFLTTERREVVCFKDDA